MILLLGDLYHSESEFSRPIDPCKLLFRLLFLVSHQEDGAIPGKEFSDAGQFHEEAEF
jgi:hypothetical protein